MAPTLQKKKNAPPGQYDVIIVGAGAAGLTAALSLAPLRVALITATRTEQDDCSSLWSQGGIAAAVAKDDRPYDHAADTFTASGGLTDPKTVAFYTREAKKIIDFLNLNNVNFKRDAQGDYALSREGGHRCARVLKGQSADAFGKTLIPPLWQRVKKSPFITVINAVTVTDLLLNTQQRITGVRTDYKNFHAPHVVLATGGAAGLYVDSSNPAGNIGRGLAMAYRAGARLVDLEFIQFHPTAFKTPHAAQTNALPLLTEALRGHGAYLVNRNGIRFMRKIHPMAELAPRDIVTRAIYAEQQKSGAVFLDVRHLDISEFDNLNRLCAMYKLNPKKDVIPITPAAHYHMGGILTDRHGRTDVQGLWAIGEVASSGFHGANRLASNSLLEAIIMGRLAADAIKKTPQSTIVKNAIDAPFVRKKINLWPVDLRLKTIKAMKRAMQDYVGITREENGLKLALAFFKDIEQHTKDGLDPEIADMALVCRLITAAALARCESRGGHHRLDYPFTKVELNVRATCSAQHNIRTAKNPFKINPYKEDTHENIYNLGTPAI